MPTHFFGPRPPGGGPWYILTVQPRAHSLNTGLIGPFVSELDCHYWANENIRGEWTSYVPLRSEYPKELKEEPQK